jgi:hypothetical protein
MSCRTGSLVAGGDHFVVCIGRGGVMAGGLPMVGVSYCVVPVVNIWSAWEAMTR